MTHQHKASELLLNDTLTHEVPFNAVKMLQKNKKIQ